jgi:hypothetical protein
MTELVTNVNEKSKKLFLFCDIFNNPPEGQSRQNSIVLQLRLHQNGAAPQHWSQVFLHARKSCSPSQNEMFIIFN